MRITLFIVLRRTEKETLCSSNRLRRAKRRIKLQRYIELTIFSWLLFCFGISSVGMCMRAHIEAISWKGLFKFSLLRYILWKVLSSVFFVDFTGCYIIIFYKLVKLGRDYLQEKNLLEKLNSK